MRIFWLNDYMGTMARPRGNDWLEDELKKLLRLGVHTLVCLLRKEEKEELGLDEERSLCWKHGIEYIQYSIEDLSVPEDSLDYMELVDKLYARTQEGHKIVIHCRMGIGRSSLLAAGILVKEDMEVENVFDYISQIRKIEVPDTQAQKNWFFKQFQSEF